MNDKDIYSAIGESFDDKIKLDFDDVKKRIAALEDKESAVITPITPSADKKKFVFAIAAAAACIVFIAGISSIAVLNGGMMKSEADSDSYMIYDSASLCETADEEAAYIADSTEAIVGEAEPEESAEYTESNTMSDYVSGNYGEIEISRSDMSNSDISSSDIN